MKICNENSKIFYVCAIMAMVRTASDDHCTSLCKRSTSCPVHCPSHPWYSRTTHILAVTWLDFYSGATLLTGWEALLQHKYVRAAIFKSGVGEKNPAVVVFYSRGALPFSLFQEWLWCLLRSVGIYPGFIPINCIIQSFILVWKMKMAINLTV